MTKKQTAASNEASLARLGRDDSKSKQADLTVKELQEKYGEGSIMRLGGV